MAYDCPVTFAGDHMQLPPICEASDIEHNNPCYVAFWAKSALYIEDAIEHGYDRVLWDYIERALQPSIG